MSKIKDQKGISELLVVVICIIIFVGVLAIYQVEVGKKASSSAGRANEEIINNLP